MTQRTLTTTSYALLTLLSLRDWTTYELAKQMRRNYHWFWPRAESKLYEEPRKLVALGLAESEHAYRGKRRTTVYRITADGRRALQAWVREPGKAAPTLEFEALVRVFAGEHGTVDSLRETLRAIEEEMLAWQRFGAALSEEMAATGGRFPERLHLTALVHRYLWEFSEATRRWATWAQDEIARWDDLSIDGKERWAVDTYQFPLRGGEREPSEDPDSSP